MDAAADTPHILVVDDDTRLRDLLKSFLSRSDFRVTVASSTAEARERLAVLDFDLIVLDVMMPGRDGYAVLGELKADAATCEIPIVLLTAKAGEDDVWEGWKSGADYYITKPFSIEELMYFIDMAFGSTVA